MNECLSMNVFCMCMCVRVCEYCTCIPVTLVGVLWGEYLYIISNKVNILIYIYIYIYIYYKYSYYACKIYKILFIR